LLLYMYWNIDVFLTKPKQLNHFFYNFIPLECTCGTTQRIVVFRYFNQMCITKCLGMP
jgi:hypothetical protein